MKKTKLSLFICSSLLLTACVVKTPNQSVKTYSDLTLDSGFDTFLQYQETTDDKATFDQHFELVKTEFKHLNDLFDIYNNYEGVNNLKTINDQAGVAPVEVEQVIIDLLLKAKEFYSLSNGEFDITIGSLLHVWHEYRTSGIADNEDGKLGEIPPESILIEKSQYKGWDKVIIDDEKNTVFITDKNVRLDVGGIAKGYATEVVAEKLNALGVTHGAVNAGGNNRTLGDKYDGTPWKVGIQNPSGTGTIMTVKMKGLLSFVTSGDYERFYIGTDGKQYHHIIDPKTNYPASHFHSVTIITQNSKDADCLSTTLFTLNYEDGLKFIDTYKKAHPDILLEVIWITDKDQLQNIENSKIVENYNVIYTDGLKESIQWNS